MKTNLAGSTVITETPESIKYDHSILSDAKSWVVEITPKETGLHTFSMYMVDENGNEEFIFSHNYLITE